MKQRIYDLKGLGSTQRVVVALVEPNVTLLEIGCATGYVTRHLKENMGCRVTAVEVNEESAEQARPYADRLIVGDIERPETWEQIKGPFDYALCGDVLEHLTDPWEVVRRIRGVLSPNGYVVASIPNIAYYKVRKQLLLGRFDYAEDGVMDRTHLRFFTRQSALALFEDAGLSVLKIIRAPRAKTDRRLMRFWPNGFTYQYVIKATADLEGSRSQIQEELENA